MNKKKTYKLQLPKDVNVDKANLRIHDGQIVVDVEFKEEIKPKDGDFLTCEDGSVFIYSSKEPLHNNSSCSYCGECEKDGLIVTTFSDDWVYKKGCRISTIEEKDRFLNRLNECGKKWNHETKELEDIRWRPKSGDGYWFINAHGDVVFTMYDPCDSVSTLRVERNNCFKKDYVAKVVADKFKELLKQSKAE